VRVVAVLLVALGGCTALLGLEQVSSIDRDNDNIPDAIDNCPDDSNPDQSDFDQNGRGDVCDLCTDGGADDADGDGIPDGCDGCIGRGEDVDEDHTDDGCDQCIGNGMDADHDNIDDACDDCIANGMDEDHDGTDDGCDACVTMPANVDDDGDGIENFCDPCPIGPQHDEDGDMAYDACDTCKVVNDAMQNDDDGDGVGKKCDPEDGIVDYERMDPFTVLDPSWFAEGATWTVINNESVRLQSNAPSYRWLSALRGDATISTRMKFNAAPSLLGSPMVSLIASDSASSGALRKASCGVDENGRLILSLYDNGVIIANDFSTGTVTIGAFFDLTLTVSDSNKHIRCDAMQNSAGFGIQVASDLQGLLWFPGLSVAFAEATFQYFDQIGRLP
jgi:hypothetical protein